MLLTIVLMLLQAATPHVNPEATPYPEVINTGFPWWGWPIIVFFLVIIVWKGPAAYRFYFTTRPKGVFQVDPKDKP